MGPEEFAKWVRHALYQWTPFRSSGLPTREFVASLRANKTLSALTKLCRRTRVGKSGLLRVVTYNFDNLLELRLGSFPHESFWSARRARKKALPIFHVHGFLPARDVFSPYPKGSASLPDEVVLTEDQYHREASDPYSWSNRIQLQALSDSVVLAVGLSMTDPNLRRLLDVSARSRTTPEVYALLSRAEASGPNAHDVQEIRRTRKRIVEHWPRRRQLPAAPKGNTPATDLWRQLDDAATDRQVKVMNELGVHPVWCRRRSNAGIVDDILAP